ncbi:uncharacterized protein LOC117099839 [Anneissia japonica]|uniref:uncharacterized protein LOC117099839 n=1 Tax=Anneissia japonica TaxID=1529436 RepID=UPI001425640F|nr:uncharacterized protein LOC117099839 [Anneissia japonica]
MKTAIHKFNQNATEVIRIAEGIAINLKRNLESITNDMSKFESAIEVKQKRLIKTVQKKSKELISKLEVIHKDHKVEDINSQLIKTNDLMVRINTATNEQEIETCESYLHHLKTIRNMARETDICQSFHKRHITLNITKSTQIEELINTEGIGKIIMVGDLYKVAKDDETITVTKEEKFVVKVSSIAENDAFQLTATLRNSSGEETATDVDYQESGEYKISGRCNVEGEWQMKITAGAAQIKGSPVNITVESLGLVHTISNISEYKKHNKRCKVKDVILDADGCLLVSSYHEDILLKFNKSGLFVTSIQLPQNVIVNRMHLMDNGHLMYSHVYRNCVVMCDDKFKETCSFGEGILKSPEGLTVNNETRLLYVTYHSANCVFKFSVDNGSLLGNFGSKGLEIYQMNSPIDVTLSKGGHVIVADYGNCRIQMYDVNDNFIRVLSNGIWHLHGVTTDTDENIIVSSAHRLQLFDKNGDFIKRIDHENDRLCEPFGITVISNRQRKVAVANYIPNNVKIFNY